jgi:hypothetical protein
MPLPVLHSHRYCANFVVLTCPGHFLALQHYKQRSATWQIKKNREVQTKEQET